MDTDQKHFSSNKHRERTLHPRPSKWKAQCILLKSLELGNKISQGMFDPGEEMAALLFAHIYVCKDPHTHLCEFMHIHKL